MDTSATTPERPRRIRRWLIAGGLALAALCIAASIAGAVFAADRLSATRYRLDGESMAPCFTDGTRLTATKLDDAGRRALRRGDIVVFDAPIRTAKPYIKRIAAVGGDTIAIRNQQLILNGAVLDEPYVTHQTNSRYPYGDSGDYTVPANTLFVLGDNRNGSSDSRAFGPVTLASVTHKITTPCASARPERGATAGLHFIPRRLQWHA